MFHLPDELILQIIACTNASQAMTSTVLMQHSPGALRARQPLARLASVPEPQPRQQALETAMLLALVLGATPAPPRDYLHVAAC